MRFFSELICVLFVTLAVLITVLHKSEAKGRGGVRGGGGSSSRSGFSFGGRSSSSRTSNSIGARPSSNRYAGGGYGGGYGSGYGSSGMRWSSFGSGMVAYGIMSSLALRGTYRSGYYHRTGNDHYRTSNDGKVTGTTCLNNEDFNGTVFGSFVCPMPEFDESAKYCCGSYENQTQYCCNFLDDDGRKASLVMAIVSVCGVILCIGACTMKVFKKRDRLIKFNRRHQGFNPQNINRNINGPPQGFRPSPGFVPGPGFNRLPPQSGFPIYQTNNMIRPDMVSQPPGSENVPFLQQPGPPAASPSLPYPKEDAKMPMPSYVQAPPSYNEALTIEQSKEKQDTK